MAKTQKPQLSTGCYSNASGIIEPYSREGLRLLASVCMLPVATFGWVQAGFTVTQSFVSQVEGKSPKYEYYPLQAIAALRV